MAKKKQTTDSWKIFLQKWKRITSPGRPTHREVKIYEGFAKLKLRKKQAKVLILGATPELRDMLAKYKNVQVMLVDINLDAILAMTALMKNEKTREKEIWMKANWLTAPLPQNYFDVVYGDYVVSNIPLKYQSKFLSNIKKWLKPDGYFINRCEVPRASHPGFSMQEFCQVFKNKPVNLKTINLFWEVGLWFLGRVDKERRVSPGVFYQRIGKYVKTHSEPKIKQILKKGGAFYPLEYSWSVHNDKSLKKLFSKNFLIKKIGFDPKINFIYPDAILIYCLKPKK